MCGIAGIINLNGLPVDPDLIKKMNDQMVHRGPDDEGAFVEGNVGLGIRRLSILDLSAGHQPMFNEDRSVVVVFNGEIYNSPDLRVTLRNSGHSITTHADTEVIPHLYEEYDENYVESLRGMFAIALYDITRKRLLIARDRVGIKPLYFLETDEYLVFSSEIKSLLPVIGSFPDLDPKEILRYFAYGYNPGSGTIFKGVRKLKPGHQIIVEDGEVRISRYWTLNREADKIEDKRKVLKQLEDRIVESVEMHLLSDVPLGAFLSGGIDSSVVAAVIKKRLNIPLQTFTIGFKEKDYDESAHARAVSEYLGTEHHEQIVSPDQKLPIGDLISYMDEPIADASLIPTYLVSSMARQKVKVILSGDGGDELFAGYAHHRQFVHWPWHRKFMQTIAGNLLRRLIQSFPESFKGRNHLLYHYLLDPFATYWIGLHDSRTKQIYTSEFLNGVSDVRAANAVHDALAPHLSALENAQSIDFSYYLPDDVLLKVDRASMLVSLEARVPLLDHKLVEFSAQVPDRFKFDDLGGKSILREYLATLIPRKLFERKKQGFGIPIIRWLEQDMAPLYNKYLSEEIVGKWGILRPDYIERIKRENERDKRGHQSFLWRAFVLHMWLETRYGSANIDYTQRELTAHDSWATS